MTRVYDDSATGITASHDKSELTASFDSRSSAETAVDKLKQAGVNNVRLLPGYETDRDGSAPASEGLLARLGDWLFPDEDRDLYAEGLRRGGVLVSASVNAASYDKAHGILDEEGSIDLDERADLWRTEGWTVDRDQQAAASKDDTFQTDAAANSASGRGRYTRSATTISPRVRAYEMTEDLPDDVVDDVLPTGHQRDVSEGDQPVGDRASQDRSLDDLRNGQMLPYNR